MGSEWPGCVRPWVWCTARAVGIRCRIASKAEHSDSFTKVDDPQQQAEAIAHGIASTGYSGALVPARIRRLDEAIRDLGMDLATPDLAKLDHGSGALEPAQAADLLMMAVEVIRLGASAVHNQGIADFFRAVSPTKAPNPIASFIEQLDLDGEGRPRRPGR